MTFREPELIIESTPERESEADQVRNVVAMHIAATEVREASNAVITQIEQIEATVTPRMLREAALGDRAALQAVEDKIIPLRVGQTGAHAPKDQNYRAMIRRRAEALTAQGNQVAALLLLKTIGE